MEDLPSSCRRNVTEGVCRLDSYIPVRMDKKCTARGVSWLWRVGGSLCYVVPAEQPEPVGWSSHHRGHLSAPRTPDLCPWCSAPRAVALTQSTALTPTSGVQHIYSLVGYVLSLLEFEAGLRPPPHLLELCFCWFLTLSSCSGMPSVPMGHSEMCGDSFSGHNGVLRMVLFVPWFLKVP